MNASTILKRMELEGVILTLSSSGTIKITGDGDIVNSWLPAIREHKAEIIDALTARQEPPGEHPAAIATAIPAIFATQPKGEAATVARIATVAVANPKEEKTALPAKVGVGDTAIASRWWLIHYPDRDPVEVSCCPEATHAEILERHPDAVAAEPFTLAIRQASAPLTAGEETAIRAWLTLIEETDPVAIAEVIGQCQRNAAARDYFSGRAAAELPKPEPFDREAFKERAAICEFDGGLSRDEAETIAWTEDDRRCCIHCLNLRGEVCGIAEPGGLVSARRGYTPILDLPRRCEGYRPCPDDPDRRPGMERWHWPIVC
jgi:hypothetical protein